MVTRYLTIACLGSCFYACAEEPLFPPPAEHHCAQTILQDSFPEDLVREALDHYDIEKPVQDKIVKELKGLRGEVKKRFGEKQKDFSEIVLDPEKRKQAVKRLQDSAFEVFNEAATNAGLIDDVQNQKMFYYLQQKRLDRFNQCLQDRKKDAF